MNELNISTELLQAVLQNKGIPEKKLRRNMLEYKIGKGTYLINIYEFEHLCRELNQTTFSLEKNFEIYNKIIEERNKWTIIN